jgi:hypothetical protein
MEGGAVMGKIMEAYRKQQPRLFIASKKVKQSRYTPWRRLGGEEV